jgi:predicted ArsR family transcriptional regulator
VGIARFGAHAKFRTSLALLTDRSGLSQKEIAENLEVSRQLAGYHLGELERRGELESRFWGRFRRYYLVAL